MRHRIASPLCALLTGAFNGPRHSTSSDTLSEQRRPWACRLFSELRRSAASNDVAQRFAFNASNCKLPVCNSTQCGAFASSNGVLRPVRDYGIEAFNEPRRSGPSNALHCDELYSIQRRLSLSQGAPARAMRCTVTNCTAFGVAFQ